MKTELCRDGVRNDGMRNESGRSRRPGDLDLTISVFLRGDFLRELVGDDCEAGQGTLAASIEGRVWSLCPGASVSVRAAELLDGDWEVQVGELGPDRMDGAGRAFLERRLRSGVGEAIARFRGPGG